MSMSIKEEAYTRLCEAITNAVDEKHSLHDNLVKVARDQGMNSEQTRRLVERANTMAHLKQFQGAGKSAASRQVVFETADAEKVIDALGLRGEKEKTASAEPGLAFEVEARILGREHNFLLSDAREKTASTVTAAMLWPGSLADLEEAHQYVEEQDARVKMAARQRLERDAQEHLAAEDRRLHTEGTLLLAEAHKVASSLMRGTPAETKERLCDILALSSDASEKLATLASITGRTFDLPAVPARYAVWEEPPELAELQQIMEKRAALLASSQELDALRDQLSKRA